MPIKIGADFTLNNVIVCEDVRPEPGAKWQILGAYSGDIVAASLPGLFRFGMYVDGETKGQINGPLLFRLSFDGKPIFEVTGFFEAKPGPVALPLPGQLVTLEKPGTLQFELSLDGKKWIEVASKKVLAGPIPT